jgi:phytoene dehydrogenase-like protein
MTEYDAIVVGSGPNGLAAAIVLAGEGPSVLVREAQATIGGGARSAELTLPGFVHDICSAVHPMAVSSPLFRSLPLASHGLQWIHPDVPLAHPFDDAPPAVLDRSFAGTAATLDPDGAAYRRLLAPMAHDWEMLAPEILGPMLHLPSHPLSLARFGLQALRPASILARSAFRGPRARALFGGLAAHSIVALDQPATSAIGLALAVAGHAVGWPIARGGSQQISGALASYLRSLGGTIEVNVPVDAIESLPPSRAVLLDVTPRQVAKIAGGRLPPGYLHSLRRFNYGPGIFKIDWALDWKELGTGAYLVSHAQMVEWYDAYLPHGIDREDPNVSPFFATDLTDVAPALIITADHDPLHDEGDEYASKLKAANIAVDHTCWRGMVHGQASMAGVLDAGKVLIDQVGAVLRKAFEIG